ncbi:alkaline phosphatase D family protein [Stackebrandtia soli]|uniref:alkaline phosphatase D family protein n=1 Tax=Stackebrandtia soli TaxID=1892856 RepID=UPI0039EB3C9E
MPLSRRKLMSTGLTAGLAGAVVPSMAAAKEHDHRALRHDPFKLGVASGDPSPDGFVLWTRLAPKPLSEDGLGGMPPYDYEVSWQLSTNETFTSLAATGSTVARVENAHSIHIEVSGMQPNRFYWYRFKVGRFVSPVARTRTAPAHDVLPSQLHMIFASCAQYEHGYFTAYRRMAAENPDLILHLGDYQYEYLKNTYVSPDGNIRDHEGPETETLADYRLRHAQYKSDEDLQAAHHVAPWLVVWDDHEVDNNWADEAHEKPEIPQPNFLERRKAAFRAYYENMPLRASSAPSGIDMQLYRRIRWGRLANFHMMDTRQYRSDQTCGDGWKNCPEAGDPARTITGTAQEQWLIDGFHNSDVRWDLLGQQVFFSQRTNDWGPVKLNSMDGWDGYLASRDRITSGWIDAGVRNPVVLTGDVHTAWANEIKADWEDPTTESVGVELVSTSVSTGGNGADSISADNPFVKSNPHLKFFNSQRGFVSTKIKPGELEASFIVVPKVTTTGSNAYVRAAFTIEDGDRTLYQTYDRPVDPETVREFNADDILEQTGEDADERI